MKTKDTELVLFAILIVVLSCIFAILPLMNKALSILARWLGVGM